MTTLGLVCRFQPLHRIHERILVAMASRADRLRIGIGSPEQQNHRNPFDYEERRAMVLALELDLPLEVFPVPDLYDGPRWTDQALELFGDLDRFVSANGYVRKLLEGRYRLTHPLELLPPSARAPIGGETVRLAMAEGRDWRALVPEPVAEFLEREGLVDRFRREHGLATLRDHLRSSESALREESDHVRVG